MERHPEKTKNIIIVNVDSDLEDLIPGFLERRQQDLLALAAALEQKDFVQISQMAHTLKGVGGGYGFDAITFLSQQLHQAAENQNFEEIESKLAELSDYLERLEVVFVDS